MYPAEKYVRPASLFSPRANRPCVATHEATRNVVDVLNTSRNVSVCSISMGMNGMPQTVSKYAALLQIVGIIQRDHTKCPFFES
jgi:hypothetical protein